MSVELSEAKILARQINETLVGKEVASHMVLDTERLQRIGFMNKDLADYASSTAGRYWAQSQAATPST